MQHVFYAPFLITPERTQKPVRKETLILNLRRQCARETVFRRAVAERVRCDFFQKVDQLDRMRGKICPRFVFSQLLAALKRLDTRICPLTVFAVLQLIQRDKRLLRALFFLFGGKQPP